MKTPKNSSCFDQPFYSPPTEVTVDGVSVPIRWDFETAFRFMDYVDQSEDEDDVFIRTVLEIWYPNVPKNTDEALTAAIRFYCGGQEPGGGYYAPAFSPDTCRETIYLDFLKRYGIDLNRDTVHWWVFRRLMESRNERRSHGWTESPSKPLPAQKWRG